jgi:hypothetical protein
MILTHLRAVDKKTFMADIDVGEMFLNFILHKDLRALAGVDLSHYFGDIRRKDHCGRHGSVPLWGSVPLHFNASK